MSSLLSQVFSLVLKIFQLPVSENRLPLTAATYSSRSAKKSPSPPGFLLFSSFCQTPQIILKLLFQFRRQRLRMDPVAHSIPQQYFPHTASRHLYCAPVEFAVQPDCRPPARYFPGDITVNPGGLQYMYFTQEWNIRRYHTQCFLTNAIECSLATALSAPS